MTRRSGSRIIGVLCAVAVSLSLPLTATNQAELAVLVDNVAHASAFTLERAKGDATHVLRQAGVTIRWLECSFAEAEHWDSPGCRLPLDLYTVILKILPQEAPERWIPPSALGFSQDRDIIIFLPRVDLWAAREGIQNSVILGHAIAHEIGHALLGPGHSAGGLMRNRLRIKEWRLAERGQLHFSPKEVLRIRQRIRILGEDPRTSPDQTSTPSLADARAPSTSR